MLTGRIERDDSACNAQWTARPVGGMKGGRAEPVQEPTGMTAKPPPSPSAATTLTGARPSQRERATPSAGETPEAQIDADLLFRAAGGDAGAAQELVDRHSGRVLALARRMLRGSAEAEDVVQEAMLRVWRVAPNWKPGAAKFSTWLHRVTLNLCYDRLRKKGAAPLEDAPEPEDPAPEAGDRMAQAEGADALHAAVAELPERQREAIILRHFEERSNPEIAEALGVSVEAVESLLARGRRALRKALSDRRDELL